MGRVTTPATRPPPLLPPAVRRPAAWLAGGCAVLALALGVRYHDDAVAGRLDAWLIRAIAIRPRSGALSAAADAVPVIAVLIAVAVAVVHGRRRRWDVVVFALGAPLLTTLVCETGKHVVDRTIHGGLALPSGHTAGATSALLVLAVLVLARARAHLLATAGALLLAVAAGAAAVGLTMVSLHAHYPTDTVAGFCTALALTLALALGIDAIGERRARETPVPHGSRSP